MGKLVNSRLFRYKFFNKKEDFYLNKDDYIVRMFELKVVEKYISAFFFKESSLKDLGLIYHSMDLIKNNDKYILKLYIYDSNFEEYLKDFKLLSNKNNKSGLLELFFDEQLIKVYLKLMYKRLLFLESYFLRGLLKFLKQDVEIGFYGVSNIDIDAQYVAKYFCTKLKQGYSLNEVLREIEWGLKNFKFLLGFKIACYGRFDKKSRAHSYNKVYGSVPFSTISKNIDYGVEEVILKFGLCSVKVWLHFSKDKSSTYSYVYKIK